MNLKNYNLPCCFITVIMSYSAAAAEGDIVTVPSYQLGLPDSNYLTVDEMETSGLGSSQDYANIVVPMKNSLVGKDPNDLMHWYVTTPKEGQTVECDGNSFCLTFGKKKDKSVAAVMAVWLPAPASEITVSFQSRSSNLSLAIYTYDYLYEAPDNLDENEQSGGLMAHWAENNIKNYSTGVVDGVITFNETIKSLNQASSNTFTGNYLFLVFNLNGGEQEMLDVNGIGVSFVPEYPIATIDDFDINPFNDVGINIVSIPEPATTTLSLAALGMLAARRRRR